MEQVLLEKETQEFKEKKEKKRKFSSEDFTIFLLGLSVAIISFLLIVFFGQNMTLAWIM